MEASISKSQLGILQHTLGLNEYGQGRQYRNHYVAGRGHHSYSDLLALVEQGYMAKQPATSISGGSPWFSVTDRGMRAVEELSKSQPKLTRAQRNYRDHLDADSGLTFAESLGIDVPDVEWERQWIPGDYKGGKWVDGRHVCRWRYRRITRYYWGNDVIAGEWKPTKKEAKASYKAELARRKEAQ